ncbi:S24/S26 family peptidase [Halococcus hamelinensis]|uniref:Signal peptidase I-like protein n=1 Tax=Halococcus hamelinensis 100A6 TaxID=1132509 RepID=M0M5I6_9EURY|nr:S26 family signal peptidase [Halococcus hamelinensis]EMA40966.1 Signal peptidase I-like protein [Halococcus hamelinensis 100A6]
MASGDGGDSWQWNDRETGSGGDGDDGDDGNEASGGGPLSRVRWFFDTDEEWVVFVREVLSSLGIVVVIGLVLFGVSGLWPPLVAIESESMTPHMQKGDLVFVMEEHRFAGGAAQDGTGVVTYRSGAAADYTQFDEPGDVIVYQPDGDPQATPIIHRARFWVNESENWYEKANESYLGTAENCEELANCPAPHAGFVTKGDANDAYDQISTGLDPISGPVEPSWVVGTAELRIPWLGKIRLFFGQVSATPSGSVGNETVGTAGTTTPTVSTVASAPSTAITAPTAPTATTPITGNGPAPAAPAP